MLELGSDDTAVAMRAGDLSPDDSDLAALSFFGGSVDECDALAKIEFCGVDVVNTFDLHQGAVGVGVALATLE